MKFKKKIGRNKNNAKTHVLMNVKIRGGREIEEEKRDLEPAREIWVFV